MLTDPQLKSKIDALWDRFWSGGIANPLTAIEQMSYLIFLKRLEDKDNAEKKTAEKRKTEFKSVFEKPVGGLTKKETEKCRWSYWSQLPGEEMLAYVRDTVFRFLRSLGSETSSFTQYMQDAVFVIPKPSILQEAVKIIDGMHISEQNADVQGDLYEYLLMNLTTAGKNGQFRTPRHIIRMMVKLVNPKIGESICDPAAGTGGFLVNAYEHILEANTSPGILEYDEEGKAHHLIGDMISDKKLIAFLKGPAITGYDFDTTMTRIGAMNLMLHGIDNPNFKYSDTLTKSFSEKNRYDVILANPPFKGSIDIGDINDRFIVKTTKTELLFIELIYDMLLTGGRAAVIVPDGVLFGSSNAHKAVRKILTEKCKLEGVISMPSGVFKPYAGVSTAILIFQKGAKTDTVWFYDMTADGFTLDDKRDKTDKNDIPDIIEKWELKNIPPLTPPKIGGENNRKAKSFYVPIKEIIENNYDLSINRYKEIEYETTEYDKPKVVIKNIELLEKDIFEDINFLNSLT